MPPWLPVVGSLAGDLVSGIMGDSGQREANRMNYRIAQENRAFQERMSSTAYQRAAKDLEKAGLNRILALGSPASSPSGAMATMQNPRAASSAAAGRATSSALQARLAHQNLENMRQQASNLAADTNLKNENSIYVQDQARNARLMSEQIAATTRNIQAQYGVTTAKGTLMGLPAGALETGSRALRRALEYFKFSDSMVEAILKDFEKRMKN